jgi:hypothetical protein
MLAELDMLKDAPKSDDEDMRSLDDQNTNESLTSLLIDVEDKEKNQIDNNSCFVTCASEESSTVDYTLSASICQKGNRNIAILYSKSTVGFDYFRFFLF